MNGYNFNDRTRRVLGMAREEAFRLRHEYTGTEHVLFALLRENDGVANAVLERLSIDAVRLRDTLESHVMHGTGAPATGPDLPYTSRAKTALELAMREASESGHDHVGSEHLLLGLIREKGGIAAQVLEASGATLDAARTETRKLHEAGRRDDEQ